MENMPERKFLSKRDIIIFVVVLLIAAAGVWRTQFMNFTHASTEEARLFADIYMLGVPVRRVFLDEQQTFSLVDEAEAYNVLEAILLTMITEELVEEFMEEVVQDDVLVVLSAFLENEYIELLEGVHFEVRDGSFGFLKSSCPDQVCVAMGFQNRVGGFAACLPNQLHFFVQIEDGVS